MLSLITPLIFLVCLVNCQDSFYSFKVNDIEGKEVDLDKYKGQVTLVVNTASQCGFTEAHYKALKRMHDILGFGDKFTVLAFPSNDFGDQEPWEDKEIEEYVRGHFKVEFPVFAKRHVIGANASPEWKFLTERAGAPTWNFQKYLVDREGRVVTAWDANTSVESIFDTVKAVIDGAAVPATTKQSASTSDTDRGDSGEAAGKEEL